MPSLPASPSAGRLVFLDWVRIVAFGLLVLYHVGMYYVSWPWHLKSPHAGTVLEPWMRMSSPWRLSLLFFVSGAVSAYMLQTRETGRFLRERSWRLLLPLAAGMLVVVPPQAYLEVVHRHGYEGRYLDFMRLYLGGYRGFCGAGECLILPTWNHLWFVAYLWLYTVVAWAALRLAPGWLDRAAARLRPARWGWWSWLVLPVLAFALLRAALAPRYPSTHAVVADWYNHAQYFACFAAGMVLARTPDLWTTWPRWRWPALACAVLGWALLQHVLTCGPAGGLGCAWRPLAWGMAQWGGLVALVGFAARHWHRDGPWRRYLSEAVFPVYVFHQTVIIVLADALRPLGWTPVAEGPALVAGTFALSLALYEGVRRLPALRPWFGLARRAAQREVARDASKTA